MLKRLMIALLMGATVTGTASAQAVDWTSDVSGVFSDGSKWTGPTAPGPTESAQFNAPWTGAPPATTPYTVTFDSNVANQQLFIGDNDVTFSAGGSARTYSLDQNASVQNGSLTLENLMTLDVAGGFSVGSGTSEGTLYVNDGATLDCMIFENTGETNDSLVVLGGANAVINATGQTMNTDTIQGEGKLLSMVMNQGVTALLHAQSGTFEVNTLMNEGGTVEVDNGATFKINQGVDSANNGTYLLHGGTVDLPLHAPLHNSGLISGRGSFKCSVGVPTNETTTIYNNTNIVIEDGNMDFHVGVTNDGTISIEAGRSAIFHEDVYGKIGTFTGPGRAVFKPGTKFHSGSSPGHNTFEGDVEFQGSLPMEINGTTRGTGYDAIDVYGKLTLSGSLDVTLYDQALGQDYEPQLDEEYNLLNWGSIDGTFAGGINLPAFDIESGLAWDISTLYDDGTIRVTPEPTSFGMFVFGLLGWGLVDRRRKRR